MPPDDSETNVRQLTNGPQPDDYQSFVARIENVQADIDAIDARHKENKLPFKNDIKEIYDEAQEIGIDKKALKAVVSKRRKLLKAQQAFERLDMASQAVAISIESALGPFAETELGKAAIAAQ
jgi:uncharacterized protein (UPF0335 family)